MQPSMVMRRRFADALSETTEDLVASVVKRSEADIEVYARLGRSGDTSLADNTRQHLIRLATVIRSPETATVGDQLAFDLALTRAAARLPLSNIIRCFQLATHAMWEWFVDTISEWGPSAFRDLWPLWLDYADEAVRKSAEAYMVWDQNNQEERLVAERRLLTDLFHGRLDQSIGQRQLLDIGIDLEQGINICVMVSPAAGQPLDTRTVTRLSRELRETGARTGLRIALVPRENDLVILSPALAGEDSPDWLTRVVNQAGLHGLSAVISETVTRVEDVRRAVDRTELQAHATSGCGGVIRSRDVSLLDFATHLLSADFTRYRPDFLDHLPASGATHDWVETVIAWAESGWTPRLAGKILHVHTNTVYYRLTQIEAKTGLDLGRPRDAMSLYLAARIISAQHRSKGQVAT